MASEARSRAARRGARTRARRRVEVERRGARRVDLERVERGERTLAEAFGGVPNAHDFLPRAGPYKIKDGKKTIRAFIVPKDSVPGPDGLLVYWYARGVPPPTLGGVYRTPAAVFVLAETLEASHAALGGRSYERACTGYGYFRVDTAHGGRPKTFDFDAD